MKKNISWLLFFNMLLSGLILFGLLRLGLLLMNRNLAEDIPAPVLMKSFLVGIRFDLMIICYMLLPFALWYMIPAAGWQYLKNFSRIFPWFFSICATPLFFICIAEFYFYREFHDRFNRLAIQYLKEDQRTVLLMLWNEYPLVILGLVSAAAAFIAAMWMKKTLCKYNLPECFSLKTHLKKYLPAGLIILCLLIAGARGGIHSGPPIRWGDAFFSRYIFANHLALNGLYTLYKSFINFISDDKNSFWGKNIDAREALDFCRKLLVRENESLMMTDKYPLFRFYKHSEKRRISFDPVPENVIVILMESLSAEVCGFLGSDTNATPVLDELAQKSVSFERFFSQGTHTHQGIFASMISFPNLPGHEYLMQDDLGNQHFCSMPKIFKKRGFVTGYVYNGDSRWDNQEGFFRNQSMEIFFDRDDFKNYRFMDETWGVSDEDMFLSGAEEITRASDGGQKKFFFLLQTLSNHAPFKLPLPAPFNDIKGPQGMIPRLNGVRYSDWALGEFFKKSEKLPWFSKTLFVIVGDHGFGYSPSQSLMDVSVQHIPLILYYPGDMRYSGTRIKTVGSHVDLLPMILGLMRFEAPHQSWGRDILSTAEDDRGFAFIKPSGNSDMASYILDYEFIVSSPQIATKAYRYEIKPFRVYDLTLDQDELKKREKALFSYISTATAALKNQKAGITGEDYDRHMK